MSRWIDADALIVNMRGAFIDHVEEFRAITIVKDAPSIDIVRCKECRHRNERCGMGEHRWCESLNMSTTPDDFCSLGERKESE